MLVRVFITLELSPKSRMTTPQSKGELTIMPFLVQSPIFEVKTQSFSCVISPLVGSYCWCEIRFDGYRYQFVIDKPNVKLNEASG